MIEDLAVGRRQHRARARARAGQAELSRATGGLPLPPGLFGG